MFQCRLTSAVPSTWSDQIRQRRHEEVSMPTYVGGPFNFWCVGFLDSWRNCFNADLRRRSLQQLTIASPGFNNTVSMPTYVGGPFNDMLDPHFQKKLEAVSMPTYVGGPFNQHNSSNPATTSSSFQCRLTSAVPSTRRGIKGEVGQVIVSMPTYVGGPFNAKQYQWRSVIVVGFNADLRRRSLQLHLRAFAP